MKNINETLKNVSNNIENNEYVQKVKQNKNYKYIKIGAIAVAAIIVLCILIAIFGGNKYENAATDFVEEEIKTVMGYENYTINDIDTDVVDDNNGLYVIDVNYTFSKDGKEEKDASEYYIIKSDKSGTAKINQYSYDKNDKQSKEEMKELALGEIK